MTRASPQTHPEVYEPAEDTALLLRVLATDEPSLTGLWALDVGTGGGAIARGLAERGARAIATDVSPHATRIARENAHGVHDVVRTDLATGLCGSFDIVTFNAPYLPSAPEERMDGWLDRAFHGGEGGVEVSARFVDDLPRLLAPNGRAYLVVSSRADLDRLRRHAAAAAFDIESRGSERYFFEEVVVWRLSHSGELL